MKNPIPMINRWRRRCDTAGCVVSAIAILIGLYGVHSFFVRRISYENVTSPGYDHSSDEDLVDLTLVTSAKRRGAFCLDGSLPAYHFRRGFGSGSNNWILHLEGGGWCNSELSCMKRKFHRLGSSKYMEQKVPFQGMLSNSPSQNPDFYNWNQVKIRYCDGGSYASHSNTTFKNGFVRFFRGELIWEAIMDELLSLGMSSSQQALLSGCSAGGLSALIHCDRFRERLPKTATVKCLADAGFFLDEMNLLGNFTFRQFFRDVVNLQSLAKSFPEDCTSHMDPFKCMFPREIIKTTRTPLFLVQPAYDWWQIQNILAPIVADPHNDWLKCRLDLNRCNAVQRKTLLGYRESLLRDMKDLMQRENAGFFVNSCFIHCQTWMTSTWHSPNSPRISNKTIAESVGDWFFQRGSAKLIDCQDFSCNPSCYNMAFTTLPH